jgi:lactate 2-monooxygenase
MNQHQNSDANIGRQRQSEIFIRGISGEKPRVPVNMSRLEQKARRAMSRPAFAYFMGGAGYETTDRANREAFERWRIVPRMLTGVAERDTSVELFGQRLPSPFLLAPIGVLELAHKEADVAVASAAASENIPMIFSSQASRSMEDCAAVMGASPRWFQLYWSQADDLVVSFVQRAEATGCSAIVVTVDTTLLGWRTRDMELGYLPFLRGKGIAQYTSDPVFQKALSQPAASELDRSSRKVNLASLRVFWQLLRSYPDRFFTNLRSGLPLKAVQQFIGTYSRPGLTWDNLAFLREHTRLPILLKGILHPDDARKAIDYGLDGIIVSNHGGRQVDGAIGAFDALPGVVEVVEDKMPVLFDSGIRGGADVFKALALGAKAVCLGRPYAYGLAIAGEAGVREVIRNLKADFDLTMGLAGCRSVAEINRDRLVQID